MNLPELPSDRLEQSGPLGCVLELIQQRQARPDEFRNLVARAVQRLEDMPVRQRERWLELLSYIRVMVYHDREGSEQEELRRLILATVQTDERRREVEAMFRSGAEVLREEGREEGLEEGAIRALQDALLDLMRTKYRRIPRGTEKVIRGTRDQDELHAWLVRTGKAETIQEIGIAP